MKKRVWTAVLAAAALGVPGGWAFAQAGGAEVQKSYDPDPAKRRTDGHTELRPIAGALVPLNSLTGQTLLLTGLELFIPLTTPLSLAIGGWGANGTDYTAAEFHVGVKYRFLDFHSVAIPFFLGGIQHTWGFPGGAAKDKRTATGFGFQGGMGIDFAATDRMRPGIQALFDFGPKLLPNAGVMVHGQVTIGITFVL